MVSHLFVFLCLSLTFLSFLSSIQSMELHRDHQPMGKHQRSSTNHPPWSFIVIIIEAPLWSPIVDQIGREVEKHQATNEERDERGRLRVKTVWVKFWICDLYIQICSDGLCNDVGGVFCSDGLLKIAANDGFCVCFAVRHGLIFIFWVQMGWMWQWSGGCCCCCCYCCCCFFILFYLFIFFLIWVFGSGGILVGSGHGGVVGMVVVVRW